MKEFKLFNRWVLTFQHTIYRELDNNELVEIVFSFLPTFTLVINPPCSYRKETKWFLIFNWLVFTVQLDNNI